ncbi:MAG: hypothetical protein ACYTFZ_07055 [Planctomycetota bacterium]
MNRIKLTCPACEHKLAIAGSPTSATVQCPNCGASVEVPCNAPAAPGERRPQQESAARKDPEEASGAGGEDQAGSADDSAGEPAPQREHGATSLDLFEPHRSAVERVLDEYFRSPRRPGRKGRRNLVLVVALLVLLSAAALALCVLVLVR